MTESEYFNTPDEVTVCDNWYDIDDFNASPFLVNPNLGKGVLWGEPGYIHLDIIYQILFSKGIVTADDLDENGDCDQDFLESYREHCSLVGRFWDCSDDEETDYDGIISTWGGKIDVPLFKEICDENNIDFKKCIYTFGTKIEYCNSLTDDDTSNVYDKSTVEKGKKIEANHLLPPEEKWKQTSSHRDVVGSKNGKKLTNDNGKEMTMAQYHNLIYQENKKLDKIVTESIGKFLINEIASKKLYHYINAEHLLSLLKRNSMKTSNPETYDCNPFNLSLNPKYINGKDRRYISFTRNKNGKEGYPVLKYSGAGDGDNHFIIRLEIDGDYFNNGNIKRIDKRYKNGYERINTKIKPLDWAYFDFAHGGDKEAMADETNGIWASNGKEWQMQSDAKDYYYPIDDDATDNYNHPMSQAEDRLTTVSKYIPNANKFIKKIDIFVSKGIDRYDYKRLWNISQKANNLGVQVNFYDDFNDFSSQNEINSFNIDGVGFMVWN